MQKDLLEAQEAGYRAAMGGFSREINQYHGKHKELYQAWLEGYDQYSAEQEEIISYVNQRGC